MTPRIIRVTACIFLILAASICMAGEEPIFVVGDDDFPPFSYDDNGRYKGIDCDVVREMFKRLGQEVRLELVPWQRLIAMTKEGKCHGAFSLFRTPERDQFALFATKKPMHESTFYLFARKNDPSLVFNSIEDLYGKRIGINRGFAISEAFDKAAADGRIMLEEVEGFELNLKKLLAGRLDAFAGNYHVAMYELNRMGLKDAVRYVPKPLTINRGAYFVVSRKANIDDIDGFVEKIDTVLGEIYEDGTYEAIVEKNLQGTTLVP